MFTTVSLAARSRSALLAIAALLLGFLSVVAPAQSASAANGSVSGTVTFGGSTVQNVGVVLRSNDDQYVDNSSTDASGNYTIANVAPGQYTLYFQVFNGPNAAPQYLGGAVSFAGAVKFTVGNGQTVTGKNAVLVAGSTISGTVKNVANANLGDVYVEAFDAAGASAGSIFTDGSGNYSIARLAAGSFILKFSGGGNYAPEYWDNQPSFATATPIAVGASSTVDGKNAVLAGGASITGNVKNSVGQNLQNATVFAYLDGEYAATSGYTGADGNFVINGLAAGTYTLEYAAYPLSNAINEFWNDKPSLELADTFPVGAGLTVAGKDAVLALGGQVSGYAYDDDGNALSDLVVVVFRAGGVEGPDTYFTTSTTTNSGYYFVPQLPAGSYKIGFTENTEGFTGSFRLAASTNYISGWHNTGTSYATAATVVITPGGAVSNVNATLQHLTFVDVTDPASTFFEPIEWMFTSGISTGTAQPSGLPRYNPAAAVSRQAMAKFLFELSGADFIAPAEPSFSDVPTSNPFYVAIEWMYNQGVSTGTPVSGGKPTFNPAAAVSRQSMAVFLARYKNVLLSIPTEQSFADVPVSATTAAAIEWMKSTGISTGTAQPSGLPLFKPTDAVSRQAMAAFLYRMEHSAG